MRIGTRASAMALAQTEDVAARLRAAWPGLAAEVVRFAPRGDRDQVSKLDRHGGKGGAFVAEIRNAMRDGALEAAMHSLKDVPGDEETPGLVLGAFLPREAASDALVARKGLAAEAILKSKAAGLKIGTNSVRRAAFLRRFFPDAEVIHFRGAVDTRLRKLDEGIAQKLPGGGEVGPADLLVVAKAGLYRVGLQERMIFEFAENQMLPAIGQGIVTVECANDDWAIREKLAAIDDASARTEAMAEREALWVLNGHCNAPIAGRAHVNGDALRLSVAVLSEDGTTILRVEGAGAAARPRELGRKVGLELLAKGAAPLIEASRPALI